MLIRRETPGDIGAIRAVTTAAFARPDQPGQVPPEAGLIEAGLIEAGLIDELRAGPAWLPALSLVAIGSECAVIGHVLCSRGHIDATPALALAPLSVHPDRQRHGVGSALMHAVLGAADALGEPLVALLGHPPYYQRFGFRPSTDYDIQPPVPEWRPHFQVRPLTGYDPALRGPFTYPEPFDRL